MLVFKIALIGIAGAMLAMVTKQFKPEYSTLVLLAVCLFLIGYLTSNLKEVLSKFLNFSKKEAGTKVLASQLFLDCRARRSG